MQSDLQMQRQIYQGTSPLTLFTKICDVPCSFVTSASVLLLYTLCSCTVFPLSLEKADEIRFILIDNVETLL